MWFIIILKYHYYSQKQPLINFLVIETTKILKHLFFLSFKEQGGEPKTKTIWSLFFYQIILSKIVKSVMSLNYLNSFLHNDIWVEGDEQIGKSFNEFYQSLFGTLGLATFIHL